MKTSIVRFAAAAVCAAGLAWPAVARAQTPSSGMTTEETSPYFMAPLIGLTMGGGDLTKTGTTVGIAAGWRGAGMWGAEFEFAHTPNFFEQTGFLIDRSSTTFMGNALVSFGTSEMRLRPYGVVGFGGMKTRLGEPGGIAAIDATKPAFDIGAGVMGSWMENVGVRVDLRYFRAFGNEDDDLNLFGYEVSKAHVVRLSAGVVIGF